jgi:tellurite resistance protein
MASLNHATGRIVVVTEDQVERAVERMTDSVDRQFMAGHMTPAEYDARIKEIDRWATVTLRLGILKVH